MMALVSLLAALAFLTAYAASRVPRATRGVYVASVIAGLLVGVAGAALYTLDNEVLHGQVDMPGDAQYYFYGAVSYLHSGVTKTYYPLYERFLAAFLRDGGPLVARIGQILVWLLAYSATVLSLGSQGISAQRLKAFSFLIIGNGLYYGLTTVFNRDILILLGLALAHSFVVKSESLVERPLLMLFPLAAIAGVVALLDALQPWFAPVVVVALLTEYLLWGVCRLCNPRRRSYGKMLVAIGVFLGALAVLGDGRLSGAVVAKSEMMTTLVQEVIVEGSMVELGGATRDILSPFRLIFGPGLIRPLFPSQYFQVWVPTHAAFYWWGTAVWYITLLIGVPLVLKRPGRFWGKRGTVLLAVLFLGYATAYVLAYGSGIGLRKRALLAYLFTTYIASTYWTSERPASSWFTVWETKIPKNIVVAMLILLLAMAQLLSV